MSSRRRFVYYPIAHCETFMQLRAMNDQMRAARYSICIRPDATPYQRAEHDKIADKFRKWRDLLLTPTDDELGKCMVHGINHRHGPVFEWLFVELFDLAIGDQPLADPARRAIIRLGDAAIRMLEEIANAQLHERHQAIARAMIKAIQDFESNWPIDEAQIPSWVDCQTWLKRQVELRRGDAPPGLGTGLPEIANMASVHA